MQAGKSDIRFWKGIAIMGSAKRINNMVRTLLLLWMFLFAGVARAESTMVESLPLQLGDYLSIEYINLLCQTRSPVKARERSDHRQYMSAKIVQNELNFTLMGSFHSGLAGFWVNAAGQFTGGYNNEFRDLKILSNSEFVITHKGKKLTYRYVGDLDQFVARNTITGKYTDSQGRVYSFTEDGVATFPERSFRFNIVEDFPRVDIDDLAEIPPGEHESIQDYSFRFVGDELQLFEMGGPIGTIRESNPFVMLTRIGDESTKP
jgi:hypothetical protein